MYKQIYFCQKYLTNPFCYARIYKHQTRVQYLAELCKGSTADSDSVCLGSNPSSAAKKKADCESNLLFSVIFACGEFYCFAVIFGLRRVIFASRVLRGEYNITVSVANNITTSFASNITLTKSAYHLKSLQLVTFMV